MARVARVAVINRVLPYPTGKVVEFHDYRRPWYIRIIRSLFGK